MFSLVLGPAAATLTTADAPHAVYSSSLRPSERGAVELPYGDSWLSQAVARDVHRVISLAAPDRIAVRAYGFASHVEHHRLSVLGVN